MPNRLFTQSAIVLFERAPTMAALQNALDGLPVVKTLEAAPERGWMNGNPGVVVAYRPEVNGVAVVDVLERPWPDGMGDPKTDPDLFAAWSMGFFGPAVFPGSLARAGMHAYGWPEAAATVAGHTAFLRIRTTYVAGAAPNTPVVPADYAPEPELRFVTRIAQRLLGLVGAVAYFNPNGETLCSDDQLDETLARFGKAKLVPLPLWSNVRMFRPEDAPGWMLMDTVGMSQLDVADHEICFPGSDFDPNAIANFLRNATHYVHEKGPVIQDREGMAGPPPKGRTGAIGWQARHATESLVVPPRATVRWFPVETEKAPEPLRRGVGGG